MILTDEKKSSQVQRTPFEKLYPREPGHEKTTKERALKNFAVQPIIRIPSPEIFSLNVCPEFGQTFPYQFIRTHAETSRLILWGMPVTRLSRIFRQVIVVYNISSNGISVAESPLIADRNCSTSSRCPLPESLRIFSLLPL